MNTVINWFLWFIAYSFIGWAYESIVCSVGERKPVNRGFLTSPVCPVYGTGAIVTIIFLYERTDNVFLLFTAGMVLTCTVEYITSVLLEKLFNAKWWDYSNYRFHINGRVSLLGAVVFGTLTVLLIKFIHPFIADMTTQISDTAQIILSSVIFIILISDLFITVRHLLTLNGKLQEIQTAINKYMAEQAKRAEGIKSALTEKFEESEFYNEHIKSLINMNRFQNMRIAKAFPKLRSIKYNDAWERIRKFLLRE